MEEKTPATFAEWIKNFREERKMGLNQFALHTGLSNATISKVESGEHIPAPATIRKIAKRWGQDEDWLLTLAGHRTPPPSTEESVNDPEMLVLFSARNINRMTPKERKMIKDLVKTILEDKGES